MSSEIEQNNSIPQVAVVGVGYWGKNLVRNFHEMGALTAICDSDKETLQRVSAQYQGCRPLTRYTDVLNDSAINAVAIATPAESHGALVKEALLAGKDVFVEKPLCLSAREGGELVALATGKGRILMVGHLLWYHPAILRLKELIDQGELGRIQYIYSNRLNLGKIRREENILWSFAPHDISVILGLVGEVPDSVQAQGGNYLHQNIADVTVSLLSFPSGILGHTFSCRGCIHSKSRNSSLSETEKWQSSMTWKRKTNCFFTHIQLTGKTTFQWPTKPRPGPFPWKW